jgi:hypothetical protein
VGGNRETPRPGRSRILVVESENAPGRATQRGKPPSIKPIEDPPRIGLRAVARAESLRSVPVGYSA